MAFETFHFGEVREILSLTDRQHILMARDAIVTIRSAISQNPDLSFSELCSQLPEDFVQRGSNLLQGFWGRYQEGHEASKYWENEYRTNKEQVLDDLRQNCHIPEDIPIEELRFGEDYGAIILEPKAVTALENHHRQYAGDSVHEDEEVWGFMSTELFLEDSQGRKLPLLVSLTEDVNDQKAADITTPHEREHIRMAMYYFRSEYMHIKPAEQEYAQELRESLYTKISQALAKANRQDVLDEIEEELLEGLSDGRMVFYHEVIAEGASGNLRDDSTCLQLVAEQINPSRNLDGEVSYGKDLRSFADVITGVVRRLEKEHMLTEDEMKHMWVTIERRLAQFNWQNNKLVEVFGAIWDQVKDDPRGGEHVFAATLLAVPQFALWRLGDFLPSSDPAASSLEDALRDKNTMPKMLEFYAALQIASTYITEEASRTLSDMSTLFRERVKRVIAKPHEALTQGYSSSADALEKFAQEYYQRYTFVTPLLFLQTLSFLQGMPLQLALHSVYLTAEMVTRNVLADYFSFSGTIEKLWAESMAEENLTPQQQQYLADAWRELSGSKDNKGLYDRVVDRIRTYWEEKRPFKLE